MLSVLLVEDEVLIALSLEYDLKKAGYSVLGRASCSEDAINCFKRTDPDLVLMDIRLAGSIDGIETAEEIKALKDIPVIFMT